MRSAMTQRGDETVRSEYQEQRQRLGAEMFASADSLPTSTTTTTMSSADEEERVERMTEELARTCVTIYRKLSLFLIEFIQQQQQQQ